MIMHNGEYIIDTDILNSDAHPGIRYVSIIKYYDRVVYHTEIYRYKEITIKELYDIFPKLLSHILRNNEISKFVNRILSVMGEKL